MEQLSPRVHPRHEASAEFADVPEAELADESPRSGRQSLAPAVRVSFPVSRHGCAGPQQAPTPAVLLTEDELVVQRAPLDHASRHVWIQFRIPGTNRELRALGEPVMDRTSERITRFRFRHLYPRDRAFLRQFIEAQAG